VPRDQNDGLQNQSFFILSGDEGYSNSCFFLLFAFFSEIFAPPAKKNGRNWAVKGELLKKVTFTDFFSKFEGNI